MRPPRPISEARRVTRVTGRARKLERTFPRGASAGFTEFISFERAITALAADGTSTDGTDGVGVVQFDDGDQFTNIGGYAKNTPPIDVAGDGLTFDAGVPDRIVLQGDGWYLIHKQYVLATLGGLSPFWVSMSGDASPIGLGGGRDIYAKGDYNNVSAEFFEKAYFTADLPVPYTTPYEMTTILGHDTTDHDVVFRISVAYMPIAG